MNKVRTHKGLDVWNMKLCSSEQLSVNRLLRAKGQLLAPISKSVCCEAEISSCEKESFASRHKGYKPARADDLTDIRRMILGLIKYVKNR